MSTLVIGDVHGCSGELDDLLDLVDCDDVVFVGDLVGKGPDSAGVVRRARALRARAVRGNHDDHYLTGRPADAGLTEDDWAWLEALPLVLRLPEHDAIVVHAGFLPATPPEEQGPEVLMYLRSILPDGSPSKRTDVGEPWASRWPGPEHVLFGHDAVRGLQRHPFATGLDTGCVYGRRLTGFLLPERTVVSTPARKVWVRHSGGPAPAPIP